jgi:hypothetical protein
MWLALGLVAMFALVMTAVLLLLAEMVEAIENWEE